MKNFLTLLACLAMATAVAVSVAQGPPRGGNPFGFGFGRPGGSGGPRGPNREEQKLVEKFDADADGFLDAHERKLARQESASPTNRRRGPGRRGPGGLGGQRMETPEPGPRVSPGDVAVYPDQTLYDPTILRTVFLEFESDDWEAELEAFHGTDVEAPATLTVDRRQYPQVGVHFRGASSFDHVPSGHKRSLNVSLDFRDEQQRLYGYKTLNLLNSHGDASMTSTVLYSKIANEHLAAPKANFVKVVINGESWGVYGNVQQFDKTFLNESFGASKGTRWKVSGSPNADGGLRYLGDDIEEYKRRFEMKSNDGEKAWRALIELCRVLNQTPNEQLVAELDPILDIDGALAFLALDVALVNQDGYWTRASDYSIFRDGDGMFHLIPHDMNEAFQSGRRGPGGPGRGGPDVAAGPGRGGPGRGGPGGDRPDHGGPGWGDLQRMFGFDGPDFGGRGPGGPGGPGGGPRGGGPGRGGIDLDPLVGLDDERFPLRSRLLAVPELRQRYLQLIAKIADESLNWETLGPFLKQSTDLIADEVAADTKKLDSTDAFTTATNPDGDKEGSLKYFVIKRSEFLKAFVAP